MGFIGLIGVSLLVLLLPSSSSSSMSVRESAVGEKKNTEAVTDLRLRSKKKKKTDDFAPAGRLRSAYFTIEV